MCHFFLACRRLCRLLIWMRNLQLLEPLFSYSNYCSPESDSLFLSDCSKDFSLYLLFRNLSMMYPGIDLFWFIPFEGHWASCISRFMSFDKFGKFTMIIFQIIFQLHNFHSFWASGDMEAIYILLLLFHRLLKTFFLNFFLCC